MSPKTNDESFIEINCLGTIFVVRRSSLNRFGESLLGVFSLRFVTKENFSSSRSRNRTKSRKVLQQRKESVNRWSKHRCARIDPSVLRNRKTDRADRFRTDYFPRRTQIFPFSSPNDRTFLLRKRYQRLFSSVSARSAKQNSTIYLDQLRIWRFFSFQSNCRHKPIFLSSNENVAFFFFLSFRLISSIWSSLWFSASRFASSSFLKFRETNSSVTNFTSNWIERTANKSSSIFVRRKFHEVRSKTLNSVRTWKF